MDTYMAPEPPNDGDEPADPYGPDSPLAALAVFCSGLGLNLPPLPEALIALLEQIDEGVFATRDDLTSLADLDGLIAEASGEDRLPYVAVSHEGYGSNAWYLRYCMVLPGAALFVTIPFGGAYMDNDAAAIEINTAFADAQPLLARALAPRDVPYVIDHRGISLSRWCTAGGEWQEVPDAIVAVTAVMG